MQKMDLFGSAAPPYVIPFELCTELINIMEAGEGVSLDSFFEEIPEGYKLTLSNEDRRSVWVMYTRHRTLFIDTVRLRNHKAGTYSKMLKAITRRVHSDGVRILVNDVREHEFAEWLCSMGFILTGEEGGNAFVYVGQF